MRSPLNTGIKSLKKKKTQVYVPKKVPSNLVAGVLNVGSEKRVRVDQRDGIRLHVSSLMKVGTYDVFCPREQALAYFEDRQLIIGSLSPGFDLLFGIGNAMHDYVRNRFIERSPYGYLAWGVWTCKCGRAKHTGYKPKKTIANICKHCKTPPHIYNEFELFSPNYNLVGHPDFYIRWPDGTMIIYEIKTIDRENIDFSALRNPLGDHTLQGDFYYHMSCKSFKKVSRNIRYLYVDRSTRSLFRGEPFKELTACRSAPSRLKPFLTKAETLLKSVEQKRLPPRICDSYTCPRAKKCHYAVSCFNRENETLDENKNKKKKKITLLSRKGKV